jgi:hypothetical protein
MTIHTWYDIALLAVSFALCDGILWAIRTLYYKWYWRRWDNNMQVPAVTSNYDWTWLVVVAIWFVFVLILRRVDRAS